MCFSVLCSDGDILNLVGMRIMCGLGFYYSIGWLFEYYGKMLCR